MRDLSSIVARARAIEARRTARQQLRQDRIQRRAEEQGFSRARYGYTRLDGRRTWLSVATSLTLARARWARFSTVWLETRDGRVVMLVTDTRTDATHGAELSRDELPTYLDGAEVMGATVRLFQPLQVTLRDYARAGAPSRKPRITPAEDGEGDD